MERSETDHGGFARCEANKTPSRQAAYARRLCSASKTVTLTSPSSSKALCVASRPPRPAHPGLRRERGSRSTGSPCSARCANTATWSFGGGVCQHPFARGGRSPKRRGLNLRRLRPPWRGGRAQRHRDCDACCDTLRDQLCPTRDNEGQRSGVGRMARDLSQAQRTGPSGALRMAPRAGIEPATYGLTVRRSTG